MDGDTLLGGAAEAGGAQSHGSGQQVGAGQGAGQQEAGQQAQSQSSGQGEQVPAYLPKEMQSDERLKGFMKPPELAKAYIDLHDKLSRAVVLPSKEATAEELAAWRKSMGAPDTPDGYDIPDEFEGVKIDKTLLKAYTQVAHENGISKEVFSKLVAAEAQLRKVELSEIKRATEKALSDATTSLRTEWGSDFEANTNVAKKFYSAVFTGDVAKAIKQAGLENNPGFIKAMVDVAKKSGFVEGKFVIGDGSAGQKSSGIFEYK